MEYLIILLGAITVGWIADTVLRQREASSTGGILAAADAIAIETLMHPLDRYLPGLVAMTDSALVNAGPLFSRDKGRQYIARSLVRATVAAIVVLFLALLLGTHPAKAAGAAFLMFVVVTALFAARLRDAVGQRAKVLDREFPYFLDFLVMVKEAGANLPQSVELFVRSAPKTVLGKEMDLILDLSRGPGGLSSALEKYQLTCPSETGRNALAGITEAEKYGAESGAMLRVTAFDMRERRNELARSAAESLKGKSMLPAMIILIGALLMIAAGNLPVLMFGF